MGGIDLEEIYGKDYNEEIKDEYTPYNPKEGHGWGHALPKKQGLYDPDLEKDACGVGFTAYVFLFVQLCSSINHLTIFTAISRAKPATKPSAMVNYCPPPND